MIKGVALEQQVGRIADTAVIHPSAQIGVEVTIGEFSVIHENVIIGDHSFVGPHCILGEPSAGFYQGQAYENPPTVIGAKSVIRSGTIIYCDTIVGDHFQTGHRVTIRENSRFGIHCRLGTLSDIQGNVKFGDYCRLHSNVHIGQLAEVGNFVWIFPYTVFTNDPHPPSDTCFQGVTVEDYAVVATDCVVFPGVRIGRDALVAAKSLVTRDVPPEMVVRGIPAQEICSIHDVKCREGKLEKPYPWRHHFSRGMPWEAEDEDHEGVGQ